MEEKRAVLWASQGRKGAQKTGHSGKQQGEQKNRQPELHPEPGSAVSKGESGEWDSHKRRPPGSACLPAAASAMLRCLLDAVTFGQSRSSHEVGPVVLLLQSCTFLS